ncbi:MAG: PD-(D/E)XK nuclease family protein, partial [Bacteroidetes bacterium]|nr:PD-(D/E)XK nuclease family protein [Bacteroidota bacterium]
SFTPNQYKRRIEMGNEILPEYYERYLKEWSKVVLVEYPFQNIELEGVPIRGQLDKLEFSGNDVNVVDYKTGNPERGLRKTRPPSEKDPLGGDYWRQAVYYKMLIDNYKFKPWKMISAELDFVEKKGTEFVKEKLIITDEHVKIVTKQMKETYENIMNHNFSPGCGKDYCFWCNFVKDQYVTEITSPEDGEQ